MFSFSIVEFDQAYRLAQTLDYVVSKSGLIM